MCSRRWRLVRGLAVWTVVALLAAVLLGGEAVASLVAAQQACFMASPATPCPGADDPAVIRLTIAFVGIPAAWLAVALPGLGWFAIRHRRDPAC